METNIVICKDCQQKKIRITVGYQGKNKLYKGEDGIFWNGSRCGPCNNTVAKQRMASIRARRKEQPLI